MGVDASNKQWIKFDLVERKPKTGVWAVVTTYSDERLGLIKWFPRWRRYAFFPHRETVYESECLSRITKFIQDLMAKRDRGMSEFVD